MSQRRKSNSSKVNLTISLVFHTLLVRAVFFLAARGGDARQEAQGTHRHCGEGKEAGAAQGKGAGTQGGDRQAGRSAQDRRRRTGPARWRTPPPLLPPERPGWLRRPRPMCPVWSSPMAPRMCSPNPIPRLLYKGLVESALRAHWNRREDIADDSYVAEIELAIDPQGNVTGSTIGSKVPAMPGGILRSRPP